MSTYLNTIFEYTIIEPYTALYRKERTHSTVTLFFFYFSLMLYIYSVPLIYWIHRKKCLNVFKSMYNVQCIKCDNFEFFNVLCCSTCLWSINLWLWFSSSWSRLDSNIQNIPSYWWMSSYRNLNLCTSLPENFITIHYGLIWNTKI